MKIGLNMGGGDEQSMKAAENKKLELLIMNAKKGDWGAKDQLSQKFRPLIESLAEKRSQDVVVINTCVEAGVKGLLTAASKYKPSIGPEGFKIFSLDFIEGNIDRALKGGGFFSRIFGKK